MLFNTIENGQKLSGWLSYSLNLFFGSMIAGACIFTASTWTTKSSEECARVAACVFYLLFSQFAGMSI